MLSRESLDWGGGAAAAAISEGFRSAVGGNLRSSSSLSSSSPSLLPPAALLPPASEAVDADRKIPRRRAFCALCRSAGASTASRNLRVAAAHVRLARSSALSLGGGRDSARQSCRRNPAASPYRRHAPKAEKNSLQGCIGQTSQRPSASASAEVVATTSEVEGLTKTR